MGLGLFDVAQPTIPMQSRTALTVKPQRVAEAVRDGSLRAGSGKQATNREGFTG
jgi:hypothetical protein